jgi:hypothetical protein
MAGSTANTPTSASHSSTVYRISTNVNTPQHSLEDARNGLMEFDLMRVSAPSAALLYVCVCMCIYGQTSCRPRTPVPFHSIPYHTIPDHAPQMHESRCSMLSSLTQAYMYGCIASPHIRTQKQNKKKRLGCAGIPKSICS